MDDRPSDRPAEALGRLRRFLLAILLFGMSGSAADLLLLGHFEDAKQIIPLALIGAAFGALAWLAWAGRARSIRSLQAVMLLFVAAGLVGIVLHVRSSMEFQSETDPSLKGRKLLMKVLQAKAPPALAPGVMVQLGLLGLAFAYRHPALGASND